MGLLLLESIFVYLLSRKYHKFAIYFTQIQSCVAYITILESSILGNPSMSYVDGFIIMSAMHTSISFVCYNQKT